MIAPHPAPCPCPRRGLPLILVPLRARSVPNDATGKGTNVALYKSVHSPVSGGLDDDDSFRGGGGWLMREVANGESVLWNGDACGCFPSTFLSSPSSLLPLLL